MTMLHIGNGTVYLQNWINIDLPSDNTFLAEERPDLVEKYKTSELDYYGKHKDQDISRFRCGPKEQETVCDRYGSFFNIPSRANTIYHILSRQVFEHLSQTEANTALKECVRVLKSRSYLTIDVPDNFETLRKYVETKDRFYIRHFVGPQSRGEWGNHIMSYTKESLCNLLKEHGFVFINEHPNIHSYPALCYTFQKI